MSLRYAGQAQKRELKVLILHFHEKPNNIQAQKRELKAISVSYVRHLVDSSPKERIERSKLITFKSELINKPKRGN